MDTEQNIKNCNFVNSVNRKSRKKAINCKSVRNEVNQIKRRYCSSPIKDFQ